MYFCAHILWILLFPKVNNFISNFVMKMGRMFEAYNIGINKFSISEGGIKQI